jgi:ketosteroid isomerase-like protein
MKKFLAAFLLGASCLAGLLAVQSRGQQSEQELRALVPKIVASWETLDLAKIEPYYAPDADLTYFDLAPLKYDNWAEYRAGAQKNLFEPNSSIKVKINNDLRVHSRGKLAWATFTFGADITNKQGTTSHLDGRWTMVLEKRAKGWIVVHEHVSVPLGGGA